MADTSSPEPAPTTSTSSAPGTLAGKVLFITGASRGIGEAIALRAARDGARIAVVGKTSEPHPKLRGTVHATCAAIELAGGEALACIADIRDDQAVARAVQATVERFGGIDILVNNASAISLSGTADTPMKRFDLMQSVNVRGTFSCSRECLPFLKQSDNPHILTLSPPPKLRADWFAPHLAYTISKYGMSMCTLAWATELAPTNADVTRASRSTHAIAIWASVWPRRCAMACRARTLERFCSVSSSRANDLPCVARAPSGTPSR